MAHRHFEDLILTDRPLDSTEAGELRAHLDTCETCSRLHEGWPQIALHLQQARIVAPAAGFSQRWQSRLARRRGQNDRRQSWLILAGVSFSALLLSSLLLGNWLGSFQSPVGIVFAAAEDLAVVFSLLNVALELVVTLARSFPLLAVVSLWAVLGTSILMLVLWIVSLQQVAFQRRI